MRAATWHRIVLALGLLALASIKLASGSGEQRWRYTVAAAAELLAASLLRHPRTALLAAVATACGFLGAGIARMTSHAPFSCPCFGTNATISEGWVLAAQGGIVIAAALVARRCAAIRALGRPSVSGSDQPTSHGLDQAPSDV